jgi:SpoVK/Ycf46/Vps4 family AAA+-type ATPase
MLLREASIFAIKRSKDNNQILIKTEDFTKAMKKVFPSVSKHDELTYIKLQKSIKKSRAHIKE